MVILITKSYGGKTRMSAQKLKACGFPSFGSAAYLAPFFFFFFFKFCHPPFEYQHISPFQYPLWLGQVSYSGSILVRLSREVELIWCLCVCMYVYVCMCIYIYIYIYAYVYVRLWRSTHPKMCKLSQQASHLRDLMMSLQSKSEGRKKTLP